ncbi:MAG: TonB family protein [Betaproteobacteria bacterium]|nr:TonB family protein [Betaproteobacteria bacterium]MDE2122831.1 TonB family protein [Betaproteobacteria bacterium]MDE2186498.1 TonB family protein [Betaproteobacteria bacterium]MDE2323389.1 TonB family protein [Betaproteobacteria bacterium]
MSAVLQQGPQPWREPHDAQRWPLAAGAALLLEVVIVGALLGLADHDVTSPPPAPMQIVLDAPKPAPQTLAPPVPKPPEPKPVPKAMPKPRPVVHKALPRPRPQPEVQPAPPSPKVQAPPAPAPDTQPAMPVAAPTPPAPPQPPVPPAPEIASIQASFEAALRSAIQAAVRYPQAARLMRLSGKTLVGFDFRDGVVSHLRVVTSSGAGPLDHAALDAVRNAPYPVTPRVLQGKTMAFTIGVRFRLNDQ